MTTETTATPAADMLIKPRMTPDPSPLRISTFAQPEYAKLTFLYGKGTNISPTTPVHAREFTVKIPTGSQAGALTAEPDLIRYELTVTGGGRDWRIDKDSRDPNQVIFTCLPPYQETAVFDGTWQIKLELWGIEVNTGIGPVEVVFQEETSRTGNDNDWVVRTGRSEVSKRDDSFVFHSLRPASTVIGYNTRAKLDWEGTSNATYTMYYRNAAGVNTPVTVSGGTWTTPADAPLKQHTDFILKASFGGKDYYLTTSVEVKDPDIVATSVTASGNISTTNGTVSGKNVSATNGTVTATGNISTTADAITASGNISTTNGTVSGKNVSATNGTVTATGNISTTSTVSGGTVNSGGKPVVTMNTPIAIARNTKINVGGNVRTYYLELENKSAWGHWNGIPAWGTPSSDSSRTGRAFYITNTIGNLSDAADTEEGAAGESTTQGSE